MTGGSAQHKSLPGEGKDAMGVRGVHTASFTIYIIGVSMLGLY